MELNRTSIFMHSVQGAILTQFSYWNWGLYASDPASSPIFDGSDYSMGSNGEYIAGRGDLELALDENHTVYLPAGYGGGCVYSGPFTNMTVNLGPVSLPLNNGSTATSANNGFNWNPRCLVRDVTTEANLGYANSSSMINLLTVPDDIKDFQETMQGKMNSGDLGVHGGGHYTIGGNPADDVYISPGDPIFFLHVRAPFCYDLISDKPLTLSVSNSTA